MIDNSSETKLEGNISDKSRRKIQPLKKTTTENHSKIQLIGINDSNTQNRNKKHQIELKQ